MERFNRVGNPSRYDFRTQSLIPLKAVNFISLAIGVLTIILSVISYVHLQQRSNAVICTAELLRQNVEGEIGCQILSDWNIYTIAAIITSVLQVAITTASVFWKWAQSKTNVWCAIHGLVVVVFSTVFIFSLISFHSQGDKNEAFLEILSSGNQKLFAALVGSDLIFSLIALIFVSSFYGLEVHFGYRRLISPENMYA